MIYICSVLMHICIGFLDIRFGYRIFDNKIARILENTLHEFSMLILLNLFEILTYRWFSTDSFKFNFEILRYFFLTITHLPHYLTVQRRQGFRTAFAPHKSVHHSQFTKIYNLLSYVNITVCRENATA